MNLQIIRFSVAWFLFLLNTDTCVDLFVFFFSSLVLLSPLLTLAITFRPWVWRNMCKKRRGALPLLGYLGSYIHVYAHTLSQIYPRVRSHYVKSPALCVFEDPEFTAICFSLQVWNDFTTCVVSLHS